MRENLFNVFCAVIFTVGVVALAVISQPRRLPPPFETTPRILDFDPEFYTGHEVRVQTGGCEQTGEKELTYRKRTDQPPCCVLRFRNRIPDKLPESVVGLCRGRNGDHVVVVDCR